ncbi:TPA: hypothetical protein EYP37_07865 [Candidatus Poribacteria bacterium]|nr:hypothetical protein [Candidatus Poribacteria bacterium]
MIDGVTNPPAQYQFRDIGREMLSEMNQELSDNIEQAKEMAKSSIDRALNTKRRVGQVINGLVASKQARVRERISTARERFEAMIAIKERRAQRYRRITQERFSQITDQLIPISVVANYYINPLEE